MKTLVIIPAYNEEANIVRTVENLKHTCPQDDFIIINDGSADQTGQICRQNRYPMIDLPINLGLAGAFQTGMRYAEEQGYDRVLQFDGDGQHDPSFIREMEETMERSGCDIVIGSRFCTQKKPLTLRMLGSRMLSMAILLTTGKKVSDPTSGMRLYNRSMIGRFSQNLNFGPEPDTISYLISKGASVAEVQVQMHERIAGTSYLSMGRSARYMLHMFISILLIQFFRQRRNPL